MSIETILLTSACLIGGTGLAIGGCALRDWLTAQDERRRINERRSLEHRKLSFRRPHHRGDVLPDLILVSVVVAVALAIFHHLAARP